MGKAYTGGGVTAGRGSVAAAPGRRQGRGTKARGLGKLCRMQLAAQTAECCRGAVYAIARIAGPSAEIRPRAAPLRTRKSSSLRPCGHHCARAPHTRPVAVRFSRPIPASHTLAPANRTSLARTHELQPTSRNRAPSLSATCRPCSIFCTASSRRRHSKACRHGSGQGCSAEKQHSRAGKHVYRSFASSACKAERRVGHWWQKRRCLVAWQSKRGRAVHVRAAPLPWRGT